MENVGRTIFVGDIHGCIEELDELVRTLAVSASDRVVVLGDMIDRGPDPVGVVRRVRESGWEALCGNHEDKALRWLKNESMVKAGRPNNMAHPGEVRASQWKRLSPKDLGWLWRLPLTVKSKGWTAVHAGIEPGLPRDKQEADHMMRLRFVNRETGRHVPNGPDMRQPPGTVFWAEMWRGQESVIYGHSVFPAVRFDHHDGGMCVGIDTGCVYGGSLTAAVVDGGVLEIVSVKARQKYFSYEDRAKPQ